MPKAIAFHTLGLMIGFCLLSGTTLGAVTETLEIVMSRDAGERAILYANYMGGPAADWSSTSAYKNPLAIFATANFSRHYEIRTAAWDGSLNAGPGYNYIISVMRNGVLEAYWTGAVAAGGSSPYYQYGWTIGSPPNPIAPPFSASEAPATDDCCGNGQQPLASDVTSDPIRYFNGEIVYQASDVESLALGGWGHARSYSNRRVSSAGFHGQGWFVDQRPHIVQRTGIVIVNMGGRAAFPFTQSGSTFTALRFNREKLASISEGLQFSDGAGNRTIFYDFTESVHAFRGQFKKMYDPAGNETKAIYAASGQIQTIERILIGASPVTETFVYAHNAAGLITNVTRQVATTGAATAIRQADYEYYTGVALDSGDANMLKRVTIKDGGGAVLRQSHYRYYRASQANGYIGGLKYIVDPRSYDRMVAAGLDPISATDASVANYADHYFQYDSTLHRVTRHDIRSAGVDATGLFTYTYVNSTFPDGYNSWKTKVTEDLPDGNKNIIFSNYAGEVMLKVFKKVAIPTQQWIDYYHYDSAGRLLLHANPSAMTGYDEAKADLVDTISGNRAHVADSAGLLEYTTYYTTTTATAADPGGVAGRLNTKFVRRGETAADELLLYQDYYAHSDASGSYVYPIGSTRTYSGAGGTGERRYGYYYWWVGTTNRLDTKLSSVPFIGPSQNGSDIWEDTYETYDTFGRVVWRRHPDASQTYHIYDEVSGGIKKVIVDVNTANTADFQDPVWWESAGQHLVTAITRDGLGRPTTVVDPEGRTTHTVYRDATREVRTYPGWTGNATTGPTEVFREDLSGRYVERLTMSAVPSVASGKPAGTEPIGGLQSLSRTYFDNSGRISHKDDYVSFAMGYPAIGTLGTHFYRSSITYDARGRQESMIDAGGTITRTEYDGLSREVATLLGTGLPLVKVSEYQYDRGGIGNGLITKATVYPSGSAAAIAPRVTEMFYDHRDRLVARKSGVEAGESASVHRPIIYRSYNNLDECISEDSYDGDGIILSPNVEPTAPLAARLRARSTFEFDNRGRIFRSGVHSVNQATGSIGAALTTQHWYGVRASGAVVKVLQPGGQVAKMGYDGAGRITSMSITNGGGDVTWADAITTTGDIVLSQTGIAYDKSGNVLVTTKKERFHDETALGDLGTPTSAPKARVSYKSAYHDLSNRASATVDVGTNGGLAYVRPSGIPLRSDTVLVTSCDYDAAGRLLAVTDPRGIVTRMTYDGLGRKIKIVEAYDATINGGAPSGSSNRTTESTYDHMGHEISRKAAMPTGTNSQTTLYLYGVVTGSGTDVNSNNLLSQIRFPDKATGLASTSATDRTTFTYNAIGETKTVLDGNGSVHTYSFDVLGRRISDAVTTLGSGVNGGVRRIEYSFDTGGRPHIFTSYGAAVGGSILNQVQREYNGLSQLINEHQSMSGAVIPGSTKAVGYGYSEMAGGANHSRLLHIRYPSGRLVRHEYPAGINADISRVGLLAEDNGGPPTHLEEYSFMGLRTIVKRAHPDTGFHLTYLKLGAEGNGDAGDQYAGLDRFGRIVDQRWAFNDLASDSSAGERLRYGYDRSSRPLYRQNMKFPGYSEVYHVNGVAANLSYDPLGRLASFKRGTLSASGTNGSMLDTAGTGGVLSGLSHIESWTYSQTGGKRSRVDEIGNHTTTFNDQNQLKAFRYNSGGADPTGTTATYDNGGNLKDALTTGTQGPNYGAELHVYDAWNRFVGTGTETFTYDAIHRRIGHVAGGGINENFYYSSEWQLLETRSALDGFNCWQYVWSPFSADTLVVTDYRDTTNNTRLYAQKYSLDDGHGSITASAATFAITGRQLYNPYGQSLELNTDGTVRAIQSHGGFGFKGGFWDAGTQTHHFRYREYSPRYSWLQRDPLLYVDGMSLYEYVKSGPTFLSDPFGLASSSVMYDGSFAKWMQQPWDGGTDEPLAAALRWQLRSAHNIDETMGQAEWVPVDSTSWRLSIYDNLGNLALKGPYLYGPEGGWFTGTSRAPKTQEQEYQARVWIRDNPHLQPTQMGMPAFGRMGGQGLGRFRLNTQSLDRLNKFSPSKDGIASRDPTYARPSDYRTGTRDAVWGNNRSPNGTCPDPYGTTIHPMTPWDMAHIQRLKFTAIQARAAREGWSREQFLRFHNNPLHYRPELPSTNRGHGLE